MSLEAGCQKVETRRFYGISGVDLRRSLLVIVCQNDRKVPPILYRRSVISSRCQTAGSRVRLCFRFRFAPWG